MGGIDTYNKPGKNDDWFCRRCGTKKTESGEWKPDVDQTHKLDILPMREMSRSGPVTPPASVAPSPVRTLAQKKAYDAPLPHNITPKTPSSDGKKRGRPNQKQNRPTPTKTPVIPHITQNKPPGGGGWITASPRKVSREDTPPSRTSTPDSSTSQSKKSKKGKESWVTTGQSNVIHKPEISLKLPPGISIGKSNDQSDQKSEHEANIS